MDAPLPSKQIDEALINSEPLTTEALKALEGIYSISQGMVHFGDSAIVKSNGTGLSFFCRKNASFMVMEAGKTADGIILAGYWRFVESADIGFIKIQISDLETVNKIISGQKVPELELNGSYFYEKEKPFVIKVLDSLPNNDFLILGHRGGGRNTDRYPSSENSLEMLKYAEKLGANGVEIDIKLTKDGIPVLFHDSYISQRLVKQDYFIGQISDYTYSQLKAFCTLVNGEELPSLQEALETIVYQTKLTFVWLDIKYPGMLEKVSSLQKEYSQKAINAGRQLEIFIGIPDEDIFNEYISLENFEDYPSICELGEDYVLRAKSKVWAPNWSLGYITERVEAMQAKGIRIVIWTLDEPTFIKKFIANSVFNGILTNYPTVVSYEYYTK